MSLVLNVEILGEFKKLTEATKGSQNSLSGLEGSAKKISKGINTALGAIGVGFSLAFLVNQFKESTKAAIEDQKSKVLLTKALKDNLNVSEQQVDAIEQYISKTQIATSITDDQLRPAFAKLAIATKDTDQAMRLLNIATDVAAGTGKNLDAVVQAMSRSLAGSDTALNRLVPSLKGAADPIAELEKLFGGAAEAAANTDPYARLQIIFGEMQEQIGMALLPVLQQFSTWLATPEGQEKMQQIVDGIVAIVTGFGDLVGFISDQVMPALEQLTGAKGFEAVATAITTMVAALGTLRIALMIFAAGNPVLAGILAGLALLAAAVAYLSTKWDDARRAAGAYQSLVSSGAATGSAWSAQSGSSGTGFTGTSVMPGAPTVNAPSGNLQFTGTTIRNKPQPTTVNININRAQVNTNDVVDAINKGLKNQGSSLRIQ